MRTQDTFLHTSNCVAHVKTDAICDISAMYHTGLYIMSFWNDSQNVFDGLHTVAVSFDGSTYTVYNDYKKVNNRYVDDEIVLDEDKFLEKYKSGFILSYYFGEAQTRK